jgi:hypothetical protein
MMNINIIYNIKRKIRRFQKNIKKLKLEELIQIRKDY